MNRCAFRLLLLALCPPALLACAPSPETQPSRAPEPALVAPVREQAPAPSVQEALPAPTTTTPLADAHDDKGADDPDKLPDVGIALDVRIPMRDGVTLSATIYRPAGVTEKLPVVFDVTPYVADTNHPWAVYYAKHGYVGAVVDIRGRGDSGGAFDPFQPHPMDLTDVVEWFARQPWANGKVAMMGGSYLGMAQWLAAREAPPHLTTIVPIAAVQLGVDFPFTNGIAMSYDVQWLAYVAGHPRHENLFSDDELWRKGFAGFFERELPFRSFDTFLGMPSRFFQEMLQHRAYDPFWQKSRPTPAQYKAMRQPVLTITGHFDGDQLGALTYYGDHMKYGAPEVTAEHYLVIGPWDHAGTRDPKRDVGGVHFGEASVVDIKKLGKDWYDWRMKGGKKPELLKDRVAYYVAGPHAETWKYAPTLEAATKDHARFFLASTGGAANDISHSGSLSRTAPDAPQSAPDHYVYDPNDTFDAERTRASPQDDNWLTTEAGLSDLRGAAVVYHSAPLPQDLEVVGSMRASVWLAMDVPDTDLYAAVYEITPEGKCIMLGSDYIRARFRESLAKETLVPSGVALRYDFERFSWFARRVSKGSRIRLVVGALNSVQFEKNYDAGGKVDKESKKDARVAHVTLLHDDAHPSVLDLPVGM